MNPNNSQAALQQLQQIQSQAQDPNSILANQRQQLGVDAAQQSVTGLRGAINNTTKLLKQVAPSVMGRTGSSLVTNAQATKQISNEQAPIAQNLSEQGTAYNQANQDLNQLQQQASQAASGIYQGQQDKLSYAQNLYNTLYQKEQAAQEAERQRQLFEYQKQKDALDRADAQRAAAASARQFDTTVGLGANKGSSAPQTDPVQQQAYNDVFTRFQAVQNGQHTDGWLKSDFNATAKSAANGNAKDKAKLDIYRQLRPDLFANMGGEAIGNFSQLRF